MTRATQIYWEQRALALLDELAQVRVQLEEARRYEHRTARKLDDLLAAVEEWWKADPKIPEETDYRLYAVARRIREGQG